MLRSLLLTTCLAAFAPAAFAQQASPDTTFGDFGWADFDLSALGNGGDHLHTLGRAHGGGYVGLASRSVDNVDEYAHVVRLSDDGTLLSSVTTDVFRNYVFDAAVSPDGRRLTFGSYRFLADGRDAIALQRRLEDGSVDASFGPQGVRVLSVEGYSIRGGAIVVDDDGRTFVAGSLVAPDAAPGATNNSFVAALLPDGSPDPAFGNAGYALINIFAAGVEELYAMTLADDGHIYLGGAIFENNKADAFITRLGSNGFFDTTFGNLGTTRYDSSAGGVDWAEFCTALAINPASQRLQAVVTRSNGIGQPGTLRVFSVGGSGTMNTFVDALQGKTYVTGGHMAIDPNGRITVSTVADDADGDVGVGIARLRTNLQPDTTFAPGGARYYLRFDPDAGTFRDAITAPALLLDRGRILAGVNFGVPGSGVDTQWSVLRLQGTFLFADGLESD